MNQIVNQKTNQIMNQIIDTYKKLKMCTDIEKIIITSKNRLNGWIKMKGCYWIEVRESCDPCFDKTIHEPLENFISVKNNVEYNFDKLKEDIIMRCYADKNTLYLYQLECNERIVFVDNSYKLFDFIKNEYRDLPLDNDKMINRAVCQKIEIVNYSV